MTVSQKAALSLLISVLLFAGFSVLAFTGLFDFLETKFYNPSITSSLAGELEADALSLDNFFKSQQTRFSTALAEPAVRRSFLSNQTADDIYERTRIFGVLGESAGGLQGVRFIDSGGSRVHFSTYTSDVFYQDQNSVSYRNYPSLTGTLPYEEIASEDKSTGRIIFDEEGDRLLFSLPFYDIYEVYRGTALFSVSVRALSEQLIGEGRIKAGEDISVIANPAGILINRPASTGRSLFPQAAAIWAEGILNLTAIDSPDSPGALFLLSTKTSQGFFVGRLINESVFSFPQAMKIILLASFFLTVYLTIFLLFNLRQDSMTIVQNRLRQLQISLIEQYYERKGTMDWGRWSRELEQRRDEIRGELKRGVKTGTGKGGDIDLLIDKSWDELLTVLEGRRETGIDEDKLQLILNRIMAAPAVSAPPASADAGAASGEKPAAVPEPAKTAAEYDIPEEFLPVAEGPDTAVTTAAADEPEVLEELEGLADDEEPETVETTSGEEPELLEELEVLEELADDEPEQGGADIPEAVPAAALAPDSAASNNEPEILEELVAAETEPAETAKADEPEILEKLAAVETEPAKDEEPEVLEELGAPEGLEVLTAEEPAVLDDVEELEELDEFEDPDTVDGVPYIHEIDVPAVPMVDLEEIARRIEFGEVAPNDEEDEAPLSDDLEIASPFTTMFTNIGESWSESGQPEPYTGIAAPDLVQNETLEELQAPKPVAAPEAAGDTNETATPQSGAVLETLPAQTGFLVYKPFLAVTKTNPQLLEAEDDDNSDALVLEELPPEGQVEAASAETIIEEKNGVPFINKTNINNEERKLDAEFKTLVDSVM